MYQILQWISYFFVPSSNELFDYQLEIKGFARHKISNFRPHRVGNRTHSAAKLLPKTFSISSKLYVWYSSAVPLLINDREHVRSYLRRTSKSSNVPKFAETWHPRPKIIKSRRPETSLSKLSSRGRSSSGPAEPWRIFPKRYLLDWINERLILYFLNIKYNFSMF